MQVILAEKMQDVKLLIIVQFVHVHLVSLVNHYLIVYVERVSGSTLFSNLFYVFMYYSIIFACSFVEPTISTPTDPCNPSPCGSYSQCRNINDTPACSCLEGHIGRAPYCRPECIINTDCSAQLACVNKKCIDPCIGSCGLLSTCTVHNHNPKCECYPGYTGDPYSSCTEISMILFESQLTINLITNFLSCTNVILKE